MPNDMIGKEEAETCACVRAIWRYAALQDLLSRDNWPLARPSRQSHVDIRLHAYLRVPRHDLQVPSWYSACPDELHPVSSGETPVSFVMPFQHYHPVGHSHGR